MPKQPEETKRPALAPPDRAAALARKEASQRVEELKLRLMMLVDRYFEQSLHIIRRWMQDGAQGAAQKKR